MPVIARPNKVTRGGIWRNEYANPILVNRGDWFGKTYLLILGGHTEDVYVIEAGNESEVLDFFVDSRWGYMITINEEDVEDEANQARAGNESLPIDMTYVMGWTRCSVDYGDYLIDKNSATGFENYALEELAKPENAGFLMDLAIRHAWDEISEHFNNDWIDYVEEENAEKSDDEYNRSTAGKGGN